MKKGLCILLVSFTFHQLSLSQSTIINGKPVTEIFTDFHININDTAKTTGFGLNRAHLGYNFIPDGNFSGLIIVNIGNPEELPIGAMHRRYAYFREASISWKKDNFNISFGITGTKIFEFQQKFWGKRYIANTYQSINGYGFVADLGLVLDYKFNDTWRGDFTVMNGEGYSEIQLDNGVRTSAGLTLTPGNHWAIRVYGDIAKTSGVLQYTLVGFAGFKNELITIGAEASYKSNLIPQEGYDAWGLSSTAGINISEKNEIFIRYDYSTSVALPGETFNWNRLMDGNFLVIGLQHIFTPNIKIALNYQGTYPYNNEVQNSDMIYLNALFKF